MIEEGASLDATTLARSLFEALSQLEPVWPRGRVEADEAARERTWRDTAQALAEDPKLEKFSGKVSDSGEGRWTVDAAVDLGVPANVLTASLFARFASRDLDVFQNKVLSAQRFGFGGHVEKK